MVCGCKLDSFFCRRNSLKSNYQIKKQMDFVGKKSCRVCKQIPTRFTTQSSTNIMHAQTQPSTHSMTNRKWIHRSLLIPKVMGPFHPRPEIVKLAFPTSGFIHIHARADPGFLEGGHAVMEISATGRSVA